MKKHILFLVFIILSFLVGCEKNTTSPGVGQFNWDSSLPGEQGMNSQILDSALVQAELAGFVDALLVIRNGFIVTEKYYNGYDEFTPHQVMSVTKSFLSAMVGIALREGFIKSLDEKVMDYFPEYVYYVNDERKFDITIRHLLTMRMGIDKEENNLFQVLEEDNWIKSTIELPLFYKPGEKFSYNSLATHLLSAILTKTSNMSSLDFANKFLLKLMRIDIDHWSQDPQGYYFGGSEMFFTPREMAALGYLYLKKGKLNGFQIVPRDWIEASLTKTWINDSPEWGVLTDYNYGYLWWIGKINGYNLFMALGHGGQTVMTFPDLNLIVVSTADYNVGWDENQTRPILKIISKYVLSALIN